jgi:hypothetical protein
MAARRNAVEEKLKSINEASAELASQLSSVLEEVAGDADTRLREVITSTTLSILSPGIKEHAPILSDEKVVAMACKIIAKHKEPYTDDQGKTITPTSVPATLLTLDHMMQIHYCTSENKDKPSADVIKEIRHELYSLVQLDLDTETGADAKLRKSMGLETENLAVGSRPLTSNLILGEISKTMGALGELLESDRDAEDIAIVNGDMDEQVSSDNEGDSQQNSGQSIKVEEVVEAQHEPAVLRRASRAPSSSSSLSSSSSPALRSSSQKSLVSSAKGTLGSSSNSLRSSSANSVSSVSSQQSQQQQQSQSKKPVSESEEGGGKQLIGGARTLLDEHEPFEWEFEWADKSFEVVKMLREAVFPPDQVGEQLDMLKDAITTAPSNAAEFVKQANTVIDTAGALLTQILALATQIYYFIEDRKHKKEDQYNAARSVGIAFERLDFDKKFGVYNLCRLNQILRAQLRDMLALDPMSHEVRSADVSKILGIKDFQLDKETKEKLSSTFFLRLQQVIAPIYNRAGSLFRTGGVCIAEDAAGLRAVELGQTSYKPVNRDGPQMITGPTKSSSLDQQKQVQAARKAEEINREPGRKGCSVDDIYDIQLARVQELQQWKSWGYTVVDMPKSSRDKIFPLNAQDNSAFWNGELNSYIRKLDFSDKRFFSDSVELVRSNKPEKVQDSRVLVYLTCFELPAIDDPQHLKAKHLPSMVVEARKKSPFIMTHLASLKQPITDIVLTKRNREMRGKIGLWSQYKDKYPEIVEQNSGWVEFKRSLKVWKSYRAPVPLESSDEEKRLVSLGYEPLYMLAGSDFDHVMQGKAGFTASEVEAFPAHEKNNLFMTYGKQRPINENRFGDKERAAFAVYLVSLIFVNCLVSVSISDRLSSLLHRSLLSFSFLSSLVFFQYTLRGGTSPLTKIELHPFLSSATPSTLNTKKPEKVDKPQETELIIFEEEFRKKLKSGEVTNDAEALKAFQGAKKTLVTMLGPADCTFEDRLEPSIQKPKPRTYPEPTANKWGRKAQNSMAYHHFSYTCPNLKPDERWQRVGSISPFEDLAGGNSDTAKTVMPYLWIKRRLSYPRTSYDEGILLAPPTADECDLVTKGAIYPRSMSEVAPQRVAALNLDPKDLHAPQTRARSNTIFSAPESLKDTLNVKQRSVSEDPINIVSAQTQKAPVPLQKGPVPLQKQPVQQHPLQQQPGQQKAPVVQQQLQAQKEAPTTSTTSTSPHLKVAESALQAILKVEADNSAPMPAPEEEEPGPVSGGSKKKFF